MTTPITIQGISTLSVGMERMNPGVFARMITNWKDGDVQAGKFKDFPPKETIPFHSVIHLMDNIHRLETGQAISDIPSFDHPFIRNEKIRKLIYHQVDPMTDGWIKTPNDYIYRTMQLSRNIERFRMQTASKFIQKRKIEELNRSEMALMIINHNPIFRLFVRGIMHNWRTTEHFLASIFNTVEHIPDKTHYFIIPLAPKIFARGKFNQIGNRISTSAVTDKHSIQYCLFAQIYNFMNTNATVKSVFSHIPEEYRKKMVLVFEYAGHYLFWTLDALQSLNVRNKIYSRIFNHFNGFILNGITEQNAQANVLSMMSDEDGSESAVTNVEQEIIKSFATLTKTPIETLQSEETPTSSNTDYIDEQDQKQLDAIIRVVETLPFRMGERSTMLDLTDITSFVDIQDPELIDEEIKSIEPKIEEPTEVVISTPGIMSKDITPVYTEENLETIRLPNTGIESAQTAAQVAEIGKSYISKIDSDAEDFIQKNPTHTQARKQTLLKLSKSYKDIKIDGKRIEDILTESIDPKINPALISGLDAATVPDQSMLKSSIADMDNFYMSKLFNRHLAAVAASMATQGMYLQEIESSVTNTELTQTQDYVFKYKSGTTKVHPIRFSRPIVRPDGTFLVNGVRSAMSKQLTTKPIAKISETRVSLASNYNKTIVERQNPSASSFGEHLTNCINYITDQNPKAITDVQYGIRRLHREYICGYEYGFIVQKYHSFTVHHATQDATSHFYFGEIEERKEHPFFTGKYKVTESDWKKIEEYEKEANAIFVGIKVGNAPYTPAVYYMDLSSVLHVTGEQKDSPFLIKASILDMIQGATNLQYPKVLTEWTDIKILGAKFPVGFLLCYRFGLLAVLRMLGTKYRIINTRARVAPEDVLKPTDVTIRFAEGKALVIPRYPLKTSLILQGLAMYNTRKGSLEDYEHKDIYYQLLLDKKAGAGKTNYLIGIDDTFDMFVDFLTYERLVQLGEPTTFEGLLIRATEMLTVPYHKEASAMANHCIRSYERFNGILYNEMAAQMRIYKRQRGPSAVFSINPQAVLQRIVQDQTVMGIEDINPIHDIKTTTKLTYLGMGGRTAESFVVNDRKYPSDGIGVLSESTPSAENVSIVVQSSMDPVIENIYGLIETNVDPGKLEPTQMLSVASLLSPGVTQDDQRAA